MIPQGLCVVHRVEEFREKIFGRQKKSGTKRSKRDPNCLFWLLIEVIWFRLRYVMASIIPISCQVSKIDKTQNPPTSKYVQFQNSETNIIHPRIFQKKGASLLDRRKKFSRRGARCRRCFVVFPSETTVCNVIVQNPRSYWPFIPLPRWKCATKKHTFEFSTTNMILFQIRSSFRNTIALVHQRCGQRLRFSYLSLQTRKLLHFSKMYTCWHHWRKARLCTSRTNDDQLCTYA